MKVHYCNYSSQPDIQIFCNTAWTQPVWSQPKDLPVGVFAALDEYFYSFDERCVTCDVCLELIMCANFKKVHKEQIEKIKNE